MPRRTTQANAPQIGGPFGCRACLGPAEKAPVHPHHRQGPSENRQRLLTKAGCSVSRENKMMPELARTARNYGELLLAFYTLDLSPDERVRVEAVARNLSPEDQSFTAYRIRGITIGHPEWLRASRAPVCGRVGRNCSATRSMSCCARRCQPQPSCMIIRGRKALSKQASWHLLPSDLPLLILPQAVEARRVHLRISLCVLDRPMAQVGRQRQGIETLVD